MGRLHPHTRREGTPYLTLPFVGKMKSSRRVELPQKLVEILIDAKVSGMEVVPSKNGINLWKKLRKESGLSKFKPNVLRHTAISFIVTTLLQIKKPLKKV